MILPEELRDFENIHSGQGLLSLLEGSEIDDYINEKSRFIRGFCYESYSFYFLDNLRPKNIRLDSEYIVISASDQFKKFWFRNCPRSARVRRFIQKLDIGYDFREIDKVSMAREFMPGDRSLSQNEIKKKIEKIFESYLYRNSEEQIPTINTMNYSSFARFFLNDRGKYLFEMAHRKIKKNEK